MKRYFGFVCALIAVLAVGIGCNSLTGKTSETATNSTSNTSPSNANSTKSARKLMPPADFTFTADELQNEFVKKGVKASELQKYVGKNIAVSGKLNKVYNEEDALNWVIFEEPGGGPFGVQCYFEDENFDQIKALQKGQSVKLQGVYEGLGGMPVEGHSPDLKNCAVVSP